MRLGESREEEILTTATNYFVRGDLHPSTQEWRKECRENQGFYDGGNNAQWANDTLQILHERGQLPITVNITQGFVDNLSGVEIQSRFMEACRSDSGIEAEEKLAASLTHFLFNLQVSQNMPYKGSLKFRDMLITGLGVSRQYKEKGKYFYDWFNPYNVVFDPDNLHPQYEGAKYVTCKRWMHRDKVLKLWPHIKSQFGLSDLQGGASGNFSPELMERQSNISGSTSSGISSADIVPVIEVQYRVEKKCYYGVDDNGRPFSTFSLERSEELCHKKSEIKERTSERIMRTLYTDKILLEHYPLDPDLPDMKDFSFIPCVWKRRFSTGVCYGIMECMKDIQRYLNSTITKGFYLKNSSKMVISGSLAPGQTQESLRKELKRNDSVLLFPQNTNYKIESNAALGKEELEPIPTHLMLMQRAVGVHDESMGIQTNATSAISQKVRQVNSVRNNVYGFDNFSHMKEREARFFLDLLQGSFDENVLVQMVNEDKVESIILNLTRDINGEKVIFNDIRTLPVSLYIEEVPDYKSTFEEQREMFQSLMANPNANWIMMSAEALRMMGFREPEKMAEQMKQAMQQKMMMEQGIQSSPPQNGEQPLSGKDLISPQNLIH